MTRRTEVLSLAVLGLLHDQPLHGYELRKRVNSVLGSSGVVRALSYGSLYPCLRDMQARGWISEAGEGAAGGVHAVAPAISGRRARIVYELTADGKEHFGTMLADAGPSAWDDEGFGVHFAFFGRTDAAVRLRILEGRRSRLTERLELVAQALTRTRERWDGYTLELQRHGLESVEREVRWLTELIDTERSQQPPSTHQTSTTNHQ